MRASGGLVIGGIVRLVVFLLDTGVVILIVLVASLADPHAKLAYRVAQVWAWLNVKLCRTRIHVRGLEHLDPAASYVFMSNHRSNLDVLVLVVALWEFQLRWVAKKELVRIPFFGWALRATKQIIVNRADHAQAVASLAIAKDRIRNGVSVVFFPEGTRSKGALLPFKKGGFVFAIETGTPVVPIGISGTARILPRNGWLVRHGGDVQVVIQPPIPTAGLTLDQRDALLVGVERAIAACADGAAGLLEQTVRGATVGGDPAARGGATAAGSAAERPAAQRWPGTR
jgi:1-acyl-sn-glycerol-3-phosphate acyltransferase